MAPRELVDCGHFHHVVKRRVSRRIHRHPALDRALIFSYCDVALTARANIEAAKPRVLDTLK